MKKNKITLVERRKKALEGLQEDLKTGKLRTAGSRSETPLADKDVKRITKEIETLKQRV